MSPPIPSYHSRCTSQNAVGRGAGGSTGVVRVAGEIAGAAGAPLSSAARPYPFPSPFPPTTPAVRAKMQWGEELAGAAGAPLSPAARPPPNSLPIPSYHSRSTSHDAAGRGAGGAGGGWVGTWAGGVNGERVEGVVVMVRGEGGEESVGVLINAWKQRDGR